MTTGATGQLGLALPVQGELSGTWGNTVNNGITEYTNIAIAATLTLTGDGAVTLANTTGDASATNIVSSLTGAGTVTAQFAIIKVTGTLTTPKIITAPSYSKTYLVVNAATGSTVSFIRSGQTPALSIAVGESVYVYYNGTDYVKVAGTASGVTSFTAGTTGFTPSTATTGAVTLAGTLATANGGTNLTSFTSGGAVYATSTSVLTTGTLPATAGGTGVANNAANTITFTGNYSLGITLGANTTGTFPASGYHISSVTNMAANPVTGTPSSTTYLRGDGTWATVGAMTYPGAGIANSTGSAWGTSYTTTGSGTVVALATSPTFVTPVLGTPTSGTLSNCTVDGTNAVGYRNIPLSGTKTASYTLVAGDVGKFIILGTSGSIVIPASVFAIGDAISVFNNTAAAITCTSSAVLAYIGGSNTSVYSFSIATRGVCTILFVTTTTVVITGNVS